MPKEIKLKSLIQPPLPFSIKAPSIQTVPKDVRKDKVSANYHALTADSFGVISDSRSGGLKRDLSALFALPDQQFDDYGFGGWFYKERVHYLKEFEPNLQVVGARQRPHVEKARRGCLLRRRANPQSQLESQSQRMARPCRQSSLHQ